MRSKLGIARLIAIHSARRLWRERGRAALLVSAVALGISVFIAVLYASDAAVRSFRSSIAALGGSDSIEIRSRGGGFRLSELAPLYGAVRERFAVLPFWEGRGKVGGSPVTVIAVEPFELGRTFDGDTKPSNKIFGTADLFEKLGVIPGEYLELTLTGRTFLLSAALLPPDLVSLVVGNVLVVTPQSVDLPEDPVFTAVRVAPRQGGAIEDLRALAVALEGSASRRFFVADPRQRSDQAERLFQAFRLNIGVLVGMTLLVSGCVVFGAAQLSVLSLQRQLGALRTIGFSRRMLGGVILGEAVFLGLLGAVLGLTLGRPVTEWCAQLFLKSVSVLYTGGELPTELWGRSIVGVLPLVILAGVGVCALGAIVPAIRASRIPAGLVARSGGSGAPLKLRTFGVGAGVALSLAGSGILFAVTYGRPIFAHLSALGLIAALLVLAWPLLVAVSRLSRTALPSWCGIGGLLATSNVTAGVRVVGVAVATIGVGLSLLIGLGLMVSSFRTTLGEWIGYTIRADLFARSLEVSSGRGPARLPTEFEEFVSALPDVTAVIRFASFEDDSGGAPLTVGGQDFNTADRARVFRLISGELNAQDLRARSGVIISEAASRKLGAGVGDPVRVGGVNAEVRGIFKDYSSEHGVVLFDFDRFRSIFGEMPLTSAAILVSSPERIDGVAHAIEGSPLGREVKLQRNRELRETIFSIFDQTFQITTLMRGIVMVICFLGFILTVLQLHSERQHEIRTLTTLGMSQGAERTAVLLEGLLLFVPGVLLGLAGGTGLALILIYLVNPLSFGWSLDFVPTVPGYLGPIGVVLGSVFVAAWIVAFRPEGAREERERDDE
ncbi:MAG: hypothetical protein RL417_44 [Pseudomonadota bacterium]|jgi:putative ABC transport system permease protein